MRTLLLVLLLVLPPVPSATAALLNGGFEAGFAGWNTIGDASVKQCW